MYLESWSLSRLGFFKKRGNCWLRFDGFTRAETTATENAVSLISFVFFFSRVSFQAHIKYLRVIWYSKAACYTGAVATTSYRADALHTAQSTPLFCWTINDVWSHTGGVTSTTKMRQPRQLSQGTKLQGRRGSTVKMLKINGEQFDFAPAIECLSSVR